MNRRTFLANFLCSIFLTIFGGVFLFTIHTLLLNNPGMANVATYINLLAVAVFAFSLSPLRRRLNRWIEHRLLQGINTDQNYLRQLSAHLLQSTDLLSVITTSVDIMCQRLKAPYAVCYILQKDEQGELTVKQVVPWHHPSPELPSLDRKANVIDYLYRTGTSVSVEKLQIELAEEEQILRHNVGFANAEAEHGFISDHAAKATLLETLTALKSDLVVPLMTQDQLFGLIFLAPHPEKRPYNTEELMFIEIATTETLTSIQRANYFEGDLQKTEFISIASHELRTPLTAVRGYLSMILDEHLTGTELDGESLDQLRRVYNMTRELIAMVNDLLTLSRLESGKTKIEPQQIDLLEIVKARVEKHQNDAKYRNVTLKLENKRGLPNAWADPDGTAVIIDNFLSNAITYNRKQGGKVAIRIKSHIPEGMMSVEIRDTGIGMSKEQMAHLFEKFYRVASKETEGISGTGLGLNISQTYIRNMNGSISVKSHAGRGTIITVLLPLFTPDRLREATERTASENAGTYQEITQALPIGLMLLSAKRSGEAYQPADLSLLEAVGHQAIIAIQRAKLYEGDQMKTQFVSIASHELLTPIAAIEGYLNAIIEKNKTVMAPKTGEFLGNVNSAIHRLSTLVRDLLSVSRLESGRISITPQAFDIGRSIQETAAQLEFVAKEKGITLKVEKLPAHLPQAYADPERTTQVLMNLVGNAIKYNRPNGTVTVEVDPTHHEGSLKISIKDSGIGMSKEQMSHLFEKFYRVASQETVGIVGTGLGLYITKSIVERMKGHITVKSVPNKGTTFSFMLPAVKQVAS